MVWLRWLAGHFLWLVDEALDQIPAYDEGRWYRYGHWGCRWRRLQRAWVPLVWGGTD